MYTLARGGALALLKEMHAVYDTYGIYINYRHLALLCDVMTARGGIMAITRHGINRLDTGPLMRCSYEETVEVLMRAAQHGTTDWLRGVTENLILGQLAPLGTGEFDLLLDEEELKKAIELPPARAQGEAFGADAMFYAESPAPGMSPLATPYGGGMHTPMDSAGAPGPQTPGATFSPMSDGGAFSPSYAGGLQSPFRQFDGGLRATSFSPTSPGCTCLCRALR